MPPKKEDKQTTGNDADANANTACNTNGTTSTIAISPKKIITEEDTCKIMNNQEWQQDENMEDDKQGQVFGKHGNPDDIKTESNP